MRFDFIDKCSAECKKWFIEAQNNRSIRVFTKLLKRLHQQTLFYKVITSLLLLLLGATIILFFSSYVIWFAIKFIFIHILLQGIEWYLNATEKPVTP
jgi:hypothetical protein